MIRYGLILKQREKDNPIPFCRVSYILSNIGDLVKCYGRMLRFPDDRNLYFAEMRLAIGDVLMQCELSGEDYGFGDEASKSTLQAQWGIPHYEESDPEICIERIVEHSSQLLRLVKYYNKRLGWRFGQGDFKYYVCETASWTGSLCKCLGLDIDDIRHLGFIHTIERYSQFEDEGWK